MREAGIVFRRRAADLHHVDHPVIAHCGRTVCAQHGFANRVANTQPRVQRAIGVLNTSCISGRIARRAGAVRSASS